MLVALNSALFLQNLLSDIARKESDLNNVSKNAQLYQQAVKVSFSPLIVFFLYHMIF